MKKPTSILSKIVMAFDVIAVIIIGTAFNVQVKGHYFFVPYLRVNYQVTKGTTCRYIPGGDKFKFTIPLSTNVSFRGKLRSLRSLLHSKIIRFMAFEQLDAKFNRSVVFKYSWFTLMCDRHDCTNLRKAHALTKGKYVALSRWDDGDKLFFTLSKDVEINKTLTITLAFSNSVKYKMYNNNTLFKIIDKRQSYNVGDRIPITFFCK